MKHIHFVLTALLSLSAFLPACGGSSPSAETASPSTSEPVTPDAESPSPQNVSAWDESEDETRVEAPSTVEVDIINRCSETIEFCVVNGGSEKHTRLSVSTHERYQVRPGATVRAKERGSCGSVLYEASEEPKQEAILCQ